MASLQSSKHLYESLKLTSPKSIRLLQIHGSTSDTFTNPIRCTLSLHNLADDPTYRCVSYVWGTKTGGSTIIVNDDYRLPVSKNLNAFLERMRAGSSGGYIWIDAVCINQAVTREKNNQVAMMGDIYAQASQVIAWLGWEWDRLGDASDNGTNDCAENLYPDIMAQDDQARALLEAEVARNAAVEAGTWVDEDSVDAPAPADTSGSANASSGAQKSNKTEDPTEVAIDFIRILAPAFQDWVDRGGNPWSESLSRYGFDAPEMYLMLGIPRIRTKSWAALAHFLNRQWFQRTWIVQEAALAKKLVVVCGAQILPWDHIVKTCIFLQASGWFHRLVRFINPTGIMVGPGYAGIVFASLQNVCNLEQVNPLLGPIVRSPFVREFRQDIDLEIKLFLFYLRVGRHFGATEKHDKIYAPLALLKRVRASLMINWPEFTPRIQMTPDYDRSVVDVYVEAAILIMKNTPDLTLLSEVEVRADPIMKGLPSWVPDFSNMNIAEFAGIPGLQYEALPGTVNDVVYSDVGHTLRLSSHLYDELVDLDANLDLSFDTLFETKDFRPWIEHCLKIGKAYTIINDETYMESLWRSMIGNFYGNVQPAPPKTAASFKCYIQLLTATKLYKDVVDITLQRYDKWHEWKCFDELRAAIPACVDAVPSVSELQDFAEHTRSVFAGEPPPGSNNRSWRKNENTAYSRLPALKSASSSGYAYGLALGRMYPMRRFFRTKKGYMGLAPRSAVTGDRIAFLSGGRTPFVLRHDSRYGPDDFELVGECYLHGFMQGEILSAQKKPVFGKITIR